MFKVCLLVVLALAGAQAQNAASGESAAPEPYSYGYQTETHSAAEQRDPSGTVTGYYTLADADGRQRRVEYVADAAGFRAKVATNEVGTKSENSADVEVQAYPATEGQLVQQAAPAPVQAAPATVQVQQPQRVYSQQVVAAPQRTGVRYAQQPGYGYAGYGYSGYPYTLGNRFADYNIEVPYTRYGAYNGAAYGGYGAATGNNGAYYANYNNHLPSQYYRSIGQPIGYGAQGTSRYVSSSTAVPANSGIYSTGYQTIGVPSAVGYQTVPATRSNAAIRGSSNYIVLQKRDSQAAEKETAAKSS